MGAATDLRIRVGDDVDFGVTLNSIHRFGAEAAPQPVNRIRPPCNVALPPWQLGRADG
jgi:hypothetical protein